MTSLTTTQMAAHIRKCIKREGIKARVRVSPAAKAVQVSAPAYDVRFTSDDCRMIAFIAKCNKLTMARGVAIDVDLHAQLTGANQFDFFMPRPA